MWAIIAGALLIIGMIALVIFGWRMMRAQPDYAGGGDREWLRDTDEASGESDEPRRDEGERRVRAYRSGSVDRTNPPSPA
jgi:hypothetical protein